MMSDYAREGLDLEEEDRLPWLEPADAAEDEDGVSPLTLLAFILGGLLLLGAIVGGVYWLQNRNGDAAAAGDGTLIAAPKGDYKIPAKEADAKKFAGEGDASYAASEGVERDGKIDPARVPEAPVTGGVAGSPAPAAAAKVAAAKPANRVSAPVADETRAASAKPAAVAKASAGGPMIQLGAYGSEASAKDAWSRLSKRFDYLAPLSIAVQPVAVGNTTLYRLRAGAGSVTQAGALCGKLRVAGESCIVVN